MIPVTATQRDHLLKQHPHCWKDQSQCTRVYTSKHSLDRRALSQQLPEWNDDALEDQAWTEDGNVAHNGASETIIANVDHGDCSEIARKVEVGTGKRLNKWKADEELLASHPAGIDDIGLEEWDDDRSSTKDDGTYKVKGWGEVPIARCGSGDESSSDKDGYDQKTDKEGQQC